MDNENDIEQKILFAAREVFIRRGYDSATMSDIALLAGISRTSLNYHFRTKERLFEAIFESTVSKLLPKIESITHSKLSFLEKLDNIAQHYQNIITENPSLPVFIIQEQNRDFNHLKNVFIKAIGNTDVPFSLIGQMKEEMEQGKIKSMEPFDVLSIFVGCFIFPVLSTNALTAFFCNGDSEIFKKHISQRKELTMRIMNDLLKP